jgi:hypothetical protein
MGLARLDDTEYARRARERNNRVNAAHRQRLLTAGKMQTNVWLSAALRRQLEERAEAEQINLSTVVERLLQNGLRLQESPHPLPLFTPAPTERESTRPSSVEAPVDRDTAIIALHGEGLSLNPIAARLAQMGILTQSGNTIGPSTISRVLQKAGLKANGELKR